MQGLLESYQSGDHSLEQLNEKYQEIGTENHDILKYRPLLEHAREHHD